jgi:hypothetical protein
MSRERESASIASKEPESELVCGTLGEIGQRRMSIEVGPVWRIFAAASIAAISRTFTTRSAITRAKTTGSCFLRGRKQEGTKEQCGVENDWEVC